MRRQLLLPRLLGWAVFLIAYPIIRTACWWDQHTLNHQEETP